MVRVWYFHPTLMKNKDNTKVADIHNATHHIIIGFRPSHRQHVRLDGLFLDVWIRYQGDGSVYGNSDQSIDQQLFSVAEVRYRVIIVRCFAGLDTHTPMLWFSFSPQIFPYAYIDARRDYRMIWFKKTNLTHPTLKQLPELSFSKWLKFLTSAALHYFDQQSA